MFRREKGIKQFNNNNNKNNNNNNNNNYYNYYYYLKHFLLVYPFCTLFRKLSIMIKSHQNDIVL